jgi:hypothetical protein
MSSNIEDYSITFGESAQQADGSSALPIQAVPYIKPNDDFRHHPVTATTIFFLAITVPYTDTYTIFGPAPSFAGLRDKIMEIASDSPPGLTKLATISEIFSLYGGREENPAYVTGGFRTMILDGQHGTYKVLQVLAVENAEVKSVVLPAPVFNVTRHGPIVNLLAGVGAKAKVIGEKGMAATSSFVGCYTKKEDAVEAAQKAMDQLVEGKEGVMRHEKAGSGAEAGVLMALAAGCRWQVKILYGDQVFQQAMEKAETEGKDLEWRF